MEHVLSVPETRDMMCAVCNRVIQNRQRLTLLDSPIGDGDHGIGMSRGMEHAKSQLLAKGEFKSVNDVFYCVGRSMISVMGGSSGVVFGTMFMGAASLPEKMSLLTGEAFVRMMRQSLDSVKKRGKANPGDKTMVDALEPAVLAMEASDSKELSDLLRTAVGAADKGAEATKEMTARHGHSKTLGERSLGHPDPGAVSVVIIFQAMEDYVKKGGI